MKDVTEIGGFWKLLEGQLAECDAEMLKVGHIRTEDKPGDFSPEFTAKPHSDPWYAAKVGWRCWLTLDNLKSGVPLREIDGLRILQIGQWAMEWQWHSNFYPHILRGQMTLASAREGGLARGRETSGTTKALLSRMNELISTDHSVQNAARIASREGVGSSAEANRKAWSRHRQK